MWMRRRKGREDWETSEIPNGGVQQQFQSIGELWTPKTIAVSVQIRFGNDCEMSEKDGASEKHLREKKGRRVEEKDEKRVKGLFGLKRKWGLGDSKNHEW